VRSRGTAALVVLAVLAVVSLAGCGGGSPSSAAGPVANVSSSDPDGLNGIVLPKPYSVPDIPLESTTGQRVGLAADTGKPLTLVFFGYTNCPDICQVVMANIASALVRLDDQQRSKVGMVFVTTDPKRDTKAVLTSYLARFDPSFTGLTGDLPSIVRLGQALSVPVERGKKLASGGYDVAHGTQIVGLRPDRTAPFVWTEGTAPNALADDITAILDDKVPGL
jgi:protein SCO1/2